jgi:hypothetical protein
MSSESTKSTPEVGASTTSVEKKAGRKPSTKIGKHPSSSLWLNKPKPQRIFTLKKKKNNNNNRR